MNIYGDQFNMKYVNILGYENTLAQGAQSLSTVINLDK